MILNNGLHLDEDKFELVRHEVKTNQVQLEQVKQLVSQVLCTTLTPQGGDQGELYVGPEVIIENFKMK